MKRKIAWAAAVLGILLAAVVAAVAVSIGGFYVLVLIFAERFEPLEPPGPIDRDFTVTAPVTCDTYTRAVPYLPLDLEPEAVLICVDLEGSQDWAAPLELVEGDLDHLVDTLASLREADPQPYECTAAGGPAYRLLIRFPRNRWATINGDTGGCDLLTVQAAAWYGARDVLDAALKDVERQRRRTGPPTEVPQVDLSCDQLTPGVIVPLSYTRDVTDVVRLVSCSQRIDGAAPGTWWQEAATRREVRVLARDLGNASPDLDRSLLGCRGGRPPRYSQWLLGQTAWGDLVAMSGNCRTFTVFDVEVDRPARIWHPSIESQRILDQLRR